MKTELEKYKELAKAALETEQQVNDLETLKKTNPMLVEVAEYLSTQNMLDAIREDLIDRVLNAHNEDIVKVAKNEMTYNEVKDMVFCLCIDNEVKEPHENYYGYKTGITTNNDEKVTFEIVDGSEIPYKLINN